jgi:hypothetical protein
MLWVLAMSAFLLYWVIVILSDVNWVQFLGQKTFGVEQCLGSPGILDYMIGHLLSDSAYNGCKTWLFILQIPLFLLVKNRFLIYLITLANAVDLSITGT